MLTRLRSLLIPGISGLLVSLLLVEIASRYLYPAVWQPLSADSLYYRTSGGFRLRANAHVAAIGSAISKRDTIIRTNSLGLRGTEPDRTHPTTVFLGDSIFLADYIQEEETFVHLLSEHVKEYSIPSTQFLNAGISALGIQQELSLLQELLQTINIDTVVLGFFLNDAAGCCIPAYIEAPWPFSLSRFVQTSLHTYAVRNEYFETFPGDIEHSDQIVAKRELVELSNNTQTQEAQNFYKKALKEFLPWGISFAPSTWNYYSKQFSVLKELQKTYGFKIKIVGFPVYEQTQTTALFDLPQVQLRTIADKHSWPFLDMLPILRSKPKETMRLYLYDHCHYTPAGHILIKDALVPFLDLPQSHRNT